MQFSRILVGSVLIGVMTLPSLAQEGRGGRGGQGGNPPPRAPQDPPPPDAPRDPAPPREPGSRQGAPRGGGGRISPQEAEAAWALQGMHVSQTLGLNAEQSKHVIDTYTEARQSHSKALEQAQKDIAAQAEQAGRDPEARRSMREKTQAILEDVHNSQREKLKAALATKLNAEQTDRAMQSLGTFNPGWDSMVHTLGEFKLDAEKNTQAMNAVESYVIAMNRNAAAMRQGAAEGGREGARDANRSAVEGLNNALKPLLTEEQMAKFQQSAPGLRGMPGRGGRGEGAAGRGGAGGEPGQGRGGRGGEAGGRGGAGAGGAAGGGRGGDGGSTP